MYTFIYCTQKLKCIHNIKRNTWYLRYKTEVLVVENCDAPHKRFIVNKKKNTLLKNLLKPKNSFFMYNYYPFCYR